MRVLADKNFPGEAVAALRSAGHDVIWVRTAAPGTPDIDVLAWAERDARIVLTFDRDFGELAWRARLPIVRGGAVSIAVAGTKGDRSRARAMVGQRSDWAGHFSVVQAGRVRMRKLPLSGSHAR